MLKKKTFWYLLLCISISVLPISCDIQKRRYFPGFFIQNKTSVPGKYYTSNSAPAHVASGKLADSISSNFNPPSPLWVNALKNETPATTPEKSIQQRSNKVRPLEPTDIYPLKVKTEESNAVVSKNENTRIVSEQPLGSEFKNPGLGLLAVAGSVLLLIAVRRRVKTKQEIASIADKLNRCADRFGNAENDIVESAAREAATAIKNSGDLKKAKQFEKSFHDTYISPSQASSAKHIKKHNQISRDMSYGTMSLKPDVIATAGGYAKNSAGSISWTIGEPVTETFFDGTDYLTQGFHQGIYMTATAIEEVTPQATNVSVYPNPFTSILSIKNDTNNPIRMETIDMQGNIINTQTFENCEAQIDFSNLSNALYILRVSDQDGNLIKVFKVQKVN